jgi:hypothetical protein
MSSRASGNLYGERGKKSRIANRELKSGNLYGEKGKKSRIANCELKSVNCETKEPSN